MTDETPAIRALHQVYIDRSGQSVVLSMQRLYAWRHWQAMGWDAGDLESVIALLKRKIKDRRKDPSCLNFKRLIEDLESFEEYLAEARAWKRRPTVDWNKEQVLKATGRPVTTNVIPPARTAGDVMASSKAFADFKKWRQENNL